MTSLGMGLSEKLRTVRRFWMNLLNSVAALSVDPSGLCGSRGIHREVLSEGLGVGAGSVIGLCAFFRCATGWYSSGMRSDWMGGKWTGMARSADVLGRWASVRL